MRIRSALMLLDALGDIAPTGIAYSFPYIHNKYQCILSSTRKAKY